jgi:hypothetical protein
LEVIERSDASSESRDVESTGLFKRFKDSRIQVEGQKVEGQKVEGQKVKGQKVKGQKVRRSKVRRSEGQ